LRLRCQENRDREARPALTGENHVESEWQHESQIGVRRRTLLKLTGAAPSQCLPSAANSEEASNPRPRLVLVTTGGIRRQESFSQEGVANIPHLSNELLNQPLFYPWTWNEGVTSHFNTISSILTCAWQHVDDRGRDKPAQPTLLQYVREQWKTGPSQPGSSPAIKL
jgi:hypothetical protein